MTCPDCGRTMTPNFVSTICEWCTSDIKDVRMYPGYIAFNEDRMDAPHYVFRRIKDVRRWIQQNDLHNLRARKVLSPTRFTWRAREGVGSFRLTIAKRLFHIEKDHRFDPKHPLVVLAPSDYEPRFRRMKDIQEKDVVNEKSEGERLLDFFLS